MEIKGKKRGTQKMLCAAGTGGEREKKRIAAWRESASAKRDTG